MATTKNYSVSVAVKEKFSIGEKTYEDISKQKSFALPEELVVNYSWERYLSDGIYGSAIVSDGKLFSPYLSGEFEVVNSFIIIDGVEKYSLDFNINDIAASSFFFQRYEDQTFKARELQVVDADVTYVDAELISIANLKGSKYQVSHSEAVDFIQGTHTLLEDAAEIIEPEYIDANRFFVRTAYFPIKNCYKITGYDVIEEGYVDLYDSVEKESLATGEILINHSNISVVKIFYFVAPVVMPYASDVYYPNPSNDGEFVVIRSHDTRLYMPYALNKTELPLLDANAEYASLVPSINHSSIEASSNVICNGLYGTSFNGDDAYMIAPSTSIFDNVSDSNFNALNATVDITTQEDVNMAVLGIFTVDGNKKRVVPIAIGIDSIGTVYQDLLTNAGLGTIGTNLEPGAVWAGTKTNQILNYYFEVDFEKYGYSFALPSIVDKNTLTVYVDDGVTISEYTDFDLIDPDVIEFDRTKISNGSTYFIEFSGLASLVISTIDLYNKKAHILFTENPFTHYNNLEEIVVLTQKEIDIRFKDITLPFIERYFENSIKLSIKPTSSYIQASLGEYKSSIYNNQEEA